ncbi:hypothetical protein [Solirubrum puertoriconensis]|uniref:STAS/SEC14 domain-containing protein n=1 Tax=Solirubrum puertoriconensis TaxID=1751427 RepID=A0A9X0HN63_SOLP1|nr:hypothetical protein [Solirubrum puertoriconensis]KUG09059.1 hypothetical protein ASU33_19755 [Solirubrum puertoriconensis]
MQLLRSYPALKLYLHAAGDKALEAQWYGAVSGTLFQTMVAEALALAQQYRFAGWVADDRLLGPLSAADVRYVGEQFMPSLIQLGLKRLALLEAVSPASQERVMAGLTSLGPNLCLQIRFFTDPIDARAWACGLGNEYRGQVH